MRSNNYLYLMRELVKTYSNIDEIFFDWIFSKKLSEGISVSKILEEIAGKATYFFSLKKYIDRLIGFGDVSTNNKNAVNQHWSSLQNRALNVDVSDFIDYVWKLKEKEEREIMSKTISDNMEYYFDIVSELKRSADDW